MEQIVVITAVGRDGPGIIAALAKTVFDLGGNLDDASMTRLHGAFAAMVAAWGLARLASASRLFSSDLEAVNCPMAWSFFVMATDEGLLQPL